MRKSLCDRIKELREDHDLTQFEVAEILGLSLIHISEPTRH